jgi:hypothetical protein
MGMNLATEQPARHMSFAQCLSDLSELSSQAFNTLYSAREHFTSRRLSTTYEAYQEWYRKLP